MKTREQIERECMAPLPREAVSQRSQGGATLSYVDQHYVINRLCDVLGPLGFETQTLALEAVCEPYKTTTSRGKEVWRVGYRATVRLTVHVPNGVHHTTIAKEGSGAGQGIDADLILAHESALKEAETDALKRAARLLGTSLGLALYDKQQADVVSEACARVLRLVNDGALAEAKAEAKRLWGELNAADRKRVTEAIKGAEASTETRTDAA